MKERIKHLLMLLSLVLLTQVAVAQITGTVKGEDGEPLAGVSVVVKGSTAGVITQFDGKYSINASEGDVLVFSMIGMATQEAQVSGSTVDVTMGEDAQTMDEVIVVAYGTATKNSFTGSATKISGDDMSKKGQSEITKALVGEAAGVQVITTSGQPGSNAAIRIRGFGSAYSSRAPLYVVDGMPYEGDISAINNADVENVTLLKDAAASALYGARAANGVVLITTKKGAKGTSKIEVDAKYGVNVRLIPLYDVVSSPERYAEFSWEALRNYGQLSSGLSREEAGLYASNNLFNTAQGGIALAYNMWMADSARVVDPVTGKISAARKYTPEKWADHIFGTGKKAEASVRFSGGADKLSYYTSFNTLDEKGYYMGSDFSRLDVRSNLQYEPREWLKATTNLSYAYMDMNNASQRDDASNNGFQFINAMPPIYPVYQHDVNGNLIYNPQQGGYMYDYGQTIGGGRGFASGLNPVGVIDLDVSNLISHQLMGNANFEVSFLDDFKFISSNGYQFLSAKNDELMNSLYGDAKGIGRITKEYDTYTAFTATQMLAYKKTFDGKHNVSAFAAHEVNYFKFSMDYASKKQLADPSNREFGNAITMTQIEGYALDKSMESYFAQVKYDYDEKYFADINFRRDGSSRFTKNRWGSFWSAGAAWLINSESFMQDLDFINHLRVKASYGTYGNENIVSLGTHANYYPTRNLYSISDLNGAVSYSLSYVGNPELTWERSSMFNTGVDFGFWDDRLEGEVEFFKKRTTDMIFRRQTPTSLGIASLPVNDGQLDNTGVEFRVVGTVVKTSDLEVKLNINGAHYKNEMSKMPMEGAREKALESQSSLYTWSKGHSIFDYYMRDYAGVDPSTGQALWVVYYDKNNLTDAGQPTRVDNMLQYLDQQAKAGKEVDLQKSVTTTYANATQDYVGKSAIPDLTGSFGLSAKYMGVELSAQFIYGIGGYGYDAAYALQMGNGKPGTYNWHNDMEQRWTMPGQVTGVPRLSSDYDVNVNSVSSRFLTSMTYLGLNNIRLGYTFPTRWMEKVKISKLTLWVSGDNLFMSTARKGYFPIGSESGTSSDIQYIPLSTFTGGINIQF